MLDIVLIVCYSVYIKAREGIMAKWTDGLNRHDLEHLIESKITMLEDMKATLKHQRAMDNEGKSPLVACLDCMAIGRKLNL